MRTHTAAILAATAVFGLAACGSSSSSGGSSASSAPPSVSSTASTPSPTSTTKEVTGASFQKWFETGLGTTIDTMCKNSGIGSWTCYFDKFDVPMSSRVDVYLSTPASGVDDKKISEDARRAVKNMINMGDKPPVHPRNIVSFVNGVDSGTTTVD